MVPDPRWPDLPEGAVLHEDDDLVVVDKPAGVSCQPTGSEVAEDLPARVRRHLATADIRAHLSLDREASGVVAYARSKRASAAMARQLEGRQPRWTFVAAIEGWRGGDRMLSHHVAASRGSVRVVPGDEKGARRVQTRVRVLERRGSRALVEASVVRGRPAQIRAQLAQAGAAVAGDARRAPSAPRLMMHARRLVLLHPVTEDEMSVEATLPAVFGEWLDAADWPETRAYVDAALARARERRLGLGRDPATTAFRLVQGAADGLTGVAVDVYGEHLVAQRSTGRAEVGEELLLDALDSLGFAGIYLKRRPRQANVIVDARGSLAPSEPVRGAPAPDPLEIRENGDGYRVRLGDGLSTGIFLDQRDNRRRVRDASEGASVLNLFAYTGAFTVVAALGGATRTVSIDSSATALEHARESLRAMGREDELDELVRADAFEALELLASAKERFDLVIVDPPTYSTTKRGRWTSGKDWVRLAEHALRVTAEGGAVLACSNDRRLDPKRFEAHLRDAVRTAGRAIAELRSHPPPADFAPPPGRPPHSKTIWLRVT